MNEILTLISENPIYLGGVSVISICLGYAIGSLIVNESKTENKNAEEIIDDYVEEIIEPELEKVSSTIPKNPKYKINSTTVAPSVLIAEDNLVNAKILIKLIKKFGIEHYVHVEDGLRALEARKENDNFDIILMDINMPNMTGDEATQAIINWENENGKSHVPIIAVTANALKGDREKYLNTGMDDYTTKPIKFDKISQLIQKHTGYKGIEKT